MEMRKGLKITLLLLLVLLVAGGLVFALTPTRKLVSFFAPEIDNVRVTDTRITEETATMNVLADVSPSFLSNFVDSVEYEFQLYDTKIAEGQKSFSQAEAQGEQQTLTIPMTMIHNVTRELVRRQVKEGEKVQARLKAYSTLPLLGPQSFDLDRKMDIVIPALPGAQVSDLKITDFGLDEMEMVMTMELDNPNEFDFTIREMNMTLNFPEKMSSVGGTVKDYLVKARSVTPIQVAATADVKKPLKTTFKTLTGDHVWPYSMKSYMVIEPKSDVVGTVEMNSVKTGTVNVVSQMKKIAKNKKEEKKAEKEKEKQEQQQK